MQWESMQEGLIWAPRASRLGLHPSAGHSASISLVRWAYSCLDCAGLHLHTYTKRHTHPYNHASVHKRNTQHTYACMHTSTLSAHNNAYKHTHAQTDRHTYTRVHTHNTRACMHACTHYIHKCMLTHDMHALTSTAHTTHTHTHAHTRMITIACSGSCPNHLTASYRPPARLCGYAPAQGDALGLKGHSSSAASLQLSSIGGSTRIALGGLRSPKVIGSLSSRAHPLSANRSVFQKQRCGACRWRAGCACVLKSGSEQGKHSLLTAWRQWLHLGKRLVSRVLVPRGNALSVGALRVL